MFCPHAARKSLTWWHSLDYNHYMTLNDAMHNLTALTLDQLNVLHRRFRTAAQEATTDRGRTIAMNRRERVKAEASRRGFLLQPGAFGPNFGSGENA